MESGVAPLRQWNGREGALPTTSTLPISGFAFIFWDALGQGFPNADPRVKLALQKMWLLAGGAVNPQ